MLFGQNKLGFSKYIGKKIYSDIQYRIIFQDSVTKTYNSSIDSLINNTKLTKWETSIKINQNNLIEANRKFKRMQIAYLNQSNYFFDSESTTKFSGILSIMNETSQKFLNKDFKEVTPIAISDNSNYTKLPYLYNISPFDTVTYISSLFFLQKIPLRYKENDKWSDTLITEKAVLLNTFTIKSISKNKLTLSFKSSAILLNHQHDNTNDSNDKMSINIFENSTTTEGYLTIDADTHFIYSILGTTERKMESNINGENKTRNTIKSAFTLYNKIE